MSAGNDTIRFKSKTTAERLAITPASREPIIDLDEEIIYVGDGVTPGGVVYKGTTESRKFTLVGKNSGMDMVYGDIGSNAYYGYSNPAQALSIGTSCTSIGSNAFQYCANLKGVSIPDSVTTIESNAFSYCGMAFMPVLNIPNSVVSIGNQGFAYSAMDRLVLPSFITTIGSNAFRYSYSASGGIHLDIECYIQKAVFDATAGASNMFSGPSGTYTLHALLGTGWTAGTGLTIGGQTMDVILDLT